MYINITINCKVANLCYDYYTLSDHIIKRISFNQLLGGIDKIKSITVLDVSRLYKNSRNLIDFYTMCKSKGIKLYDAILGIDIIGTIPDYIRELFFQRM